MRVPASAEHSGAASLSPRAGAGDFENVWGRIHSVKGCAACLGAKAVVRTCDSMRSIPRDWSPANAERWSFALTKLREVLEESRTKMEEYLPPEPTDDPDPSIQGKQSLAKP